jgi:DNA-binding transcriptional LysR family regulator
MELRQLRQFAMLAETLNFREAAQRLNMAQPPLSVSIRKLEEEIGTLLFDRSKSGVRITDAGRSVLNDARKALFHAAEVKRTARATALGLSGRLRIGFVGSAKYSLLPRLLPLFRRHYPEVALELYEKSNGEITQALENRSLEVGIIRVPFAWRSHVQTDIVDCDHFVLALPADHRLAEQETISLSDISKEPFVHYSAGAAPGLHVLTMLLFQEAGYSPRVTQEAVQVETVICLVESGLGIALVPSVAAHHKSQRVVFRELSPRPAAAAIGLAIAYEPDYETSIARRFRDWARENRTDAEAEVELISPGKFSAR